MTDPSNASSPPDAISTLSFEQALARLDVIVRQLEAGDIELDAAVGAFEEGTKLKRHCEAKLAEARERVDQITGTPDGAMGLAPLPDMD